MSGNVAHASRAAARGINSSPQKTFPSRSTPNRHEDGTESWQSEP